MPVYADPIDGLAVPANLLLAWTARLVESIGTPEDIAYGVLFFTSDYASWCTGQVLSIDGGKAMF